MPRQRMAYTAEFKLQAVRMITANTYRWPRWPA